MKQRLQPRISAACLGATVLCAPAIVSAQSCWRILNLSATPGLFAPTDRFDPALVAHRLEKLVGGKFSGAFLAMRSGVKIIERGYGYADPEKQIPISEHTVFDVASLSKSITAIAILLLEHGGKLKTSDPIKVHLPGVPDPYMDVTIQQLLTHTSGIPGRATGSGTDLEKAVGDYLSLPPVFRPGNGYEYSNGGYALLAGIVERVSRMPFEKFCRETIFNPAGMSETGFCGETFKAQTVAQGFVSRLGTFRSATPDPYPPPDQFGWEYKGMGGVLSSIADLAKLVIWIYDGGLPAEVRTKFVTPSDANPKYACGWEVFKFDDGTPCHGHGGSVAGFRVKLWWFPESRSLIILLSNRDDFDWTMVSGVKKALFQQGE